MDIRTRSIGTPHPLAFSEHFYNLFRDRFLASLGDTERSATKWLPVKFAAEGEHKTNKRAAPFGLRIGDSVTRPTITRPVVVPDGATGLAVFVS